MKEIKFEIESRLENVPLIGMAVNRICADIFGSEREAFQIELCVVEACTNAIKHAYRNEPGNRVEVVMSLYPDHLDLRIYDSGEEMDRKFLHPPEEDMEMRDFSEIPESGRGLMIINKIMDEVSYGKEGRRNVLFLRKKVEGQRSGDSA